MEYKFKEWDKIKMKRYCSSNNKWDICTLIYWKNLKFVTTAAYNDTLFAIIEWHQDWCSCTDNRELVESFRKNKKHTYNKIYKREDWVVFEKNSISEPWFDKLTIEQIKELSTMFLNKYRKLNWLLKSHKNLEF